MNNNLGFVLCIVAIVMCAKVIQTYIKQRRSKPEVDTELEETLAKVDVLEERIRVLERIVTDNRFDLKQEINDL
jgi:cell division protein FtsB